MPSRHDPSRDTSAEHNVRPHPEASGDRLAALGWDERWSAVFAGMHPSPAACTVTSDAATPDPRPGRVARVDRERIWIITERDDVFVPLHGPRGPAGSVDVVTGDWVLVDRLGNLGGVLPRRTALTRGAGRRDTRAQVLAANVDLVLVMVALSSPPNQARLDRLLTVVWQSGAQPVVVLSKADLCATADTERDEVAEGAPGTPVHLVSARDGRGLAEVRAHLAPGRTVALLGASGVGKSSLVNALAGADLLAVGPVRTDGKGRHTTTRRELLVLPGMGVLIDTPGLRGVQLWEAEDGLDQTFTDIEELAARCRFTDCHHHGEPDCAVADAVSAGRISPARLASYDKLHREVAWLRSRYDARERAEARRRVRNLSRATRGRGRR